MGGDGGAENERRQGPGNTFTSRYGKEHGIGPFAPVEFHVEEDDHGGADGHQKDDPRVLGTQICGGVDPQRKDAGGETDERSAQKTVDQQLDQLHTACPDLEYQCLHLIGK